jgi:DTW domain-containing protein YfiP
MNKSARVYCPKCEFILARCLCSSLTPLFNSTELIILQHPTETDHALNTVRLIKNSFQQIHLFIGECFDDVAELKILLAQKKTALIFPSENAKEFSSAAAASFNTILLIDGPWNKAKKIYYVSTILHGLPAFSLTPKESSRYKIRSSSIENGLSTLEAALLALKTIEPELNCKILE